MPSHITHHLFVKTAVTRAFGETGRNILKDYEGILAFSSQGPDLFYHNQRTRPGAFKYGRILHRGGYGRFLSALASRLLPNTSEEGTEARGLVSREGALILGLASHAVLDRFTHPFIISKSGWIVQGEKSTQKYFRIHAFYERVIDRILYEDLTGSSIFDYDFYSVLTEIGEDLEWFQKELIQSVFSAYPDLNKPDLSRRRLRNALRDALYFYRVTDPTREENAYKASLRDRKTGGGKRYLALYHPRILDPDVDYLNDGRKEWPDPFEKNFVRYESFQDLFEKGLNHTVSVFQEIGGLFRSKKIPSDFEDFIGNGNLSNGAMEKAPEPLYSDPLDLNSTLAQQYEYFRGYEPGPGASVE